MLFVDCPVLEISLTCLSRQVDNTASGSSTTSSCTQFLMIRSYHLVYLSVFPKKVPHQRAFLANYPIEPTTRARCRLHNTTSKDALEKVPRYACKYATESDRLYLEVKWQKAKALHPVIERFEGEDERYPRVVKAKDAYTICTSPAYSIRPEFPFA